MTRPRILMADDHAMLLDAFRALLEPEFDVVGTVTDGRMLLEAFSRLHPNVWSCSISPCRSSTGSTREDSSKRSASQ